MVDPETDDGSSFSDRGMEHNEGRGRVEASGREKSRRMSGSQKVEMFDGYTVSILRQRIFGEEGDRILGLRCCGWGL